MFNNVLHRNRTEADTARPGSEERVVDERAVDERTVDDRTADERVVDERDRNDRRTAQPGRNYRWSDEDGPTEHDVRQHAWYGRRADGTAATATAVDDRTVVERPVTPEGEQVAEPVEVERQPWAHSSAAAICGLVIGVLALAATFTGLLAPIGVAAGVIGGLCSLAGLVRASRRGVTGHSAAFVGLVASLAAVILGVLAIQGHLSWLNSDTDEVARLHNWLNTNFTWMKRW
jgi:hypothetical protein